MQFKQVIHFALRFRLLLLALIALAAVLTYIFWPSGNARPQYITAPVERGDLETNVLATGLVSPQSRVDVGVQVSGQVKSILVQLGQEVRKGDLLAEIDADLALNDLVASKAQIGSQKAVIASKQLSIADAKKELTRQNAMLKEDATTPKERDTAQLLLRQHELDLTSLRATLKQSESQLAKNQINLRYSRITAPMDGTVVAIEAELGQTVIASQSSPTLLKLANLKVMRVGALVSEADIHRVKVGQKVRFQALGCTDQHYTSKVLRIEPTPEKVNNALFFRVLFDVDNQARSLYMDTTAEVTIEIERVANTLKIPLSALMEDGRTVQILNAKGQAQTKSITTGLRSSSHVAVKNGLTEGMQVILTTDPSGPETEETLLGF